VTCEIRNSDTKRLDIHIN